LKTTADAKLARHSFTGNRLRSDLMLGFRQLIRDDLKDVGKAYVNTK
jgi:hypothetical protein